MMGLEGFGDLGSDPHGGVKGGHGLLKDHGDAAATVAAHGFFRKGEQIFVRERNVPADLGVGRKKAQNGKGGGGLAGAGLAYEAEGFAGIDMERDGLDSRMVAKGDGEVTNIEERRGVHCLYGNEIEFVEYGYREILHGKTGLADCHKTGDGLS